MSNSGRNDVDDETVLLETAAFLPLRNPCSQLPIYKIETANSSERPPHRKTSNEQTHKPECESSVSVSNMITPLGFNELFYPQQ